MASEKGAVASEARAYWSQFEPLRYSRNAVLADFAGDAEAASAPLQDAKVVFAPELRTALDAAGMASGPPLDAAFLTAASLVLSLHAGATRLLLTTSGVCAQSGVALPIFVDLDGITSFRQGLKVVTARLEEVHRYGELPIEEIRAECGLTLKGTGVAPDRFQVDLVGFGEHAACRCRYDPTAYRLETARAVAAQILILLYDGLRNLDAPLWKLHAALADSPPAAPATEEVSAVCDLSESLPTRYERVCQENADRVASVWGEERISYGAVRNLSRRIASGLKAAGIDTGAPIGVLLSSEHWRLAVALGVWRAGHAHIPLDHTLRPGALGLLLRSAGVREVITERQLVRLLRDCGVQTRCVEDLRSAEPTPGYEHQSPGTLASLVCVSALGDVPLLAEFDHEGLSADVTLFNSRLSVKSDDCILEAVPAHLAEPRTAMYGCATVGARIVAIAEEQLGAPAQWSTLLDRERVTVLRSTPELVDALLSYFKEFPHLTPLCAELRAVLLTSESICFARAERLSQVWPHVQLICAGGVVEGSGGAFVRLCRRSEPPTGRALPVEPMSGEVTPVLTESGGRSPATVRGGLHLNTRGARGYWKHPRTTASRFVPGDRPGARLFRTDHIARSLPDGTLEFIGSRNAGFSLHGTWVQLAALERLIVRVTGVVGAVVVPSDDGAGGQLIDVFVQPHSDTVFSEEQAMQELRRWLPQTLLPRRFVCVAQLDREALTRQPLAHTAPGAASDDALTGKIRGLFAGLLEVESVGPADDFFALGGYSILAIELVAQLKDTFQVNLPLSDIFEFPTPAQLAERVVECR